VGSSRHESTPIESILQRHLVIAHLGVRAADAAIASMNRNDVGRSRWPQGVRGTLACDRWLQVAEVNVAGPQSRELDEVLGVEEQFIHPTELIDGQAFWAVD